jgi:hypothetical protein
MAETNLERVSRALALLKQGLRPFVEREMRAVLGEQWRETARRSFGPGRAPAVRSSDLNWDTQALLTVMWDNWHGVFSRSLGRSERTLISELREVRNHWAHQEPFSTDDAYRAIDSVVRLLTAVSAPEAEEVEKQKEQVLRVRFEEQAGRVKHTSMGRPPMTPTFSEVYDLLLRKGPGRAESSRGTVYRIEAKGGIIVAFPRSGSIRVHADCWRRKETCQGTWAGGIYNGPYSILDWYADNR